MDYSVKQFKLVTGEEIVCEVLDESPESFAIRNAFVLHEKETVDGYKYFAFRTFMTYQDTPLSVMLIMNDKVMAIAIPSSDMTEQYYAAMDEMAEHLANFYDDDDDEPKVKRSKSTSNVQSIEDWLKDNEIHDSDTNGMIH